MNSFILFITLTLVFLIIIFVTIELLNKVYPKYWPKWWCTQFDSHPEPKVTFGEPIYYKIARCSKCKKVIFYDKVGKTWTIHDDQNAIL
jgi:hypothetical protein